MANNWMIRAGTDQILADKVEKAKAIAIGWHELGNLDSLVSRDDFKARYEQVLPEHSSTRRAVNSGQIYRFVRELKDGDQILTYLKDSRQYVVGQLTGDYRYDPTAFGDEYPHIRAVKWLKKIPRDAFSPAARDTLGSILTLFSLNSVAGELSELIQRSETQPAATVVRIEPSITEVETPPYVDEVRARADELIADMISKLDPYDFQDLVAAVLRAMGFNAVSSPPGQDGGVDIIAHPDAFGFAEPRIVAQVKHRQDKTTNKEVLQLLGALQSNDKGLFVSTGGYTTQAVQAARGSAKPLRLYNRDEFIRLLLEHYEPLADEYKAMVPLVRVWLPAKKSI